LEFCRQFLECGDAVVAIVRRPDSVSALQLLKEEWPETLHFNFLDVTDFEAVNAFGREMQSLAIDILINNAGQIGPETHKGEQGQNLETLDPTLIANLTSVNAIAPLVLTKALLPSLALAHKPCTFLLGSTVGVARETFGDYYAYRMSKAAGHIAFATLAKDLAKSNILAGVICPGWVKTDLGGPNASLEIDESVRQMIRVMQNFSPEQNGKFLDFSGRVLEY